MNSAVTSISAFFPCYGDAGSIESVVEAALDAIDRVGVDGDVTVVNDGSTDGSAVVLEKLQVRDPRVHVVTHPANRGYGGALLSGFAAATKQWVFYTDGDGQFDPTELALLVAHAGDDVDVVQGYKISRADGPVRRVIGRVYHRFVAFMFGLHIRDTDCDFRFIRRDVLKRVQLTHTTGVICVEMVRKLQDVDARFVEVPIHHYARRYGSSRFFRPSSVLRTLRDLIVMWTQLVVRDRHTSGRRAHRR